MNSNREKAFMFSIMQTRRNMGNLFHFFIMTQKEMLIENVTLYLCQLLINKFLSETHFFQKKLMQRRPKASRCLV
jgi:hypothetical protein